MRLDLIFTMRDKYTLIIHPLTKFSSSKSTMSKYVMHCAIRHYLYNLKNVRNVHGGVLLLVEMLASACNFTKSNTPPQAFFTFIKLYKWYQMAQNNIYPLMEHLSNDHHDRCNQQEYYHKHCYEKKYPHLTSIQTENTK